MAVQASGPSDRKLLPTWAGLSVLSVAAPLALGGVHFPVVAALAAACGALLILHARARHATGRRVAPGPLPAVVLAGAVFSALQVIPLPVGPLGWVSPHAAEVWTSMAPDAAARRGFLSVAPHETASAAAMLAALACLLCVVLDLGREEKHRLGLVKVAALGPSVALLVGVLQTLGGIKAPLGLVALSHPVAVVSTFINPNHAGACWLVGLFAVAGLVLTARDRDTQLPLFLLALCLLAAVFVSTSNASVVAAAAGLVVVAGGVAVLARRARMAAEGAGDEAAPVRMARRSRTVAAALLVLTLPLAILAVEMPTLAPQGRLAANAWELKKATIQGAAEVIPHAWQLGVGRGAFAEAHPRHKTSTTQYRYVQPENLELLLAAEWGIPAAVLYLGAWLWILARWVRGIRGILEVAAVAGGFAVWLENQSDFSLEAMGVAVPLFILLGAARAHVPDTRNPDREARRAAAARSSRRALWAGVAAAVLLPIPPLWAALRGQEASRARAMAQPLPARLTALEAHVVAHPTDTRATLALARGLRVQDPPRLQEALAWLGRAQFHAPMAPEPHADAGHILWTLGNRSQAVLEWRLAARVEVATHDAVPMASLLARGVPVADLLEVYAPRMAPVETCTLLAREGGPGRGEQCLRQVLLREPDAEGVRAMLALRAADRGEWDEAEALAREELARRPGHGTATLVVARALDASGRRDEAETLLQKARAQRADPVELDRFRLQRAVAAGRHDAAREALVGLSASLKVRGESQLEVTLWEARLAEREGHIRDAFTLYRNAARAHPAATEGALNAARLATQLGLKDAALSVLREAAGAYPAPEYLSELNRLDRPSAPRPANPGP